MISSLEGPFVYPTIRLLTSSLPPPADTLGSEALVKILASPSTYKVGLIVDPVLGFAFSTWTGYIGVAVFSPM